MKVFSIIDSGGLYGKERANLQVAHILQDAGMDVTLLVNSINTEVREEIECFKSINIPFPRRLKGKFLFLRYLKAFYLTNILIRRLLESEKPDFLLVPTEIELTYLYFTLHKSPVKVIFRCGDSPLINRKRGVNSLIYGYIWRKFILKRVDVVVCNAVFIQNQIVKSGRINNVKDKLIYNYPPVRTIIEDNIVYQELTGGVRFGFLGRIVEDKGVRELVDATFDLAKKGFNIKTYIGGGYGERTEYINSILNMIEQNAEPNKPVQILGLVKDMHKFFQNVDVVVVPSIYAEPMANVVTEAKFFRKPVIIFNQGGMPEIVSHMNDGYICDDVSIECLEEGMKYYIMHPEFVITHGENAYDSIERLGLTKQSFTRKWLEVFNYSAF